MPRVELKNNNPFPLGEHIVYVKNILFTDRDGQPLQNKEFDPQIIVVIHDGLGHEKMVYLDLDGKFHWRTSQWIGAAGWTEEQIATSELDTLHLLDEATARAWLPADRPIKSKVTENEKYPDSPWVNPVVPKKEKPAPLAVKPPLPKMPPKPPAAVLPPANLTDEAMSSGEAPYVPDDVPWNTTTQGVVPGSAIGTTPDADSSVPF